MPNNTTKLNLRKINPATDGNLNVNVDTDFNDNWDKLDTYATTTSNEIDIIQGQLDQAVKTTDSPTFAGLNIGDQDTGIRYLSDGFYRLVSNGTIIADVSPNGMNVFGLLYNNGEQVLNTINHSHQDVSMGASPKFNKINFAAGGGIYDQDLPADKRTIMFVNNNVLSVLIEDGSAEVFRADYGEVGAYFKNRLLWDSGNGDSRTWVAASKTSTQSLLANVLTKIAFEVEDADTLGEWSSSRFTPTNTGRYEISVVLGSNIGIDQAIADLIFMKNGVAAILSVRQAQSGTVGGQTIQGSVTVQLTAGDYFEIFASMSSDGTIEQFRDRNLITIQRIA